MIMQRTVENIGLPKDNGAYLIRFAPFYDGDRHMELDSLLCRVVGDRLPMPVWERLHPKDMWIKLHKKGSEK